MEDYTEAAKLIYEIAKAKQNNKIAELDSYFNKILNESLRYTRLLPKYIEVQPSLALFNQLFELTGIEYKKLKKQGSIKLKTGTCEKITKYGSYEHKITISSLAERISSLANEDKLTPEYINELINSIEIYYVTKDENKRLNKLGYRNKRLDPDKAYNEAGIKHLDENNI